MHLLQTRAMRQGAQTLHSRFSISTLTMASSKEVSFPESMPVWLADPALAVALVVQRGDLDYSIFVGNVTHYWRFYESTVRA